MHVAQTCFPWLAATWRCLLGSSASAPRVDFTAASPPSVPTGPSTWAVPPRTTPTPARHWNAYAATWVGGRYGYGPDPASGQYPYYGHPYGSGNYPYYGGYVSSSVFASGLRSGLYNVP